MNRTEKIASLPSIAKPTKFKNFKLLPKPLNSSPPYPQVSPICISPLPCLAAAHLPPPRPPPPPPPFSRFRLPLHRLPLFPSVHNSNSPEWRGVVAGVLIRFPSLFVAFAYLLFIATAVATTANSAGVGVFFV